MNNKKILTILALSAVLLTGCGLKQSNAIVMVNNIPITQQEFDEAFNSVSKGGSSNPKSPLYAVTKDRVINELIVKKLLMQEMDKRNITLTAEEEEQGLKDLIDKYGSKENLQTMLRQSGISNEKFKKDFATELKVKKLIKILGSTNVTDAEVKKFYKENPNRFKTPEKVRASHILISANPKEIESTLLQENSYPSEEELTKAVEEIMDSKKAKAEQIQKEAKSNPKDFAKLAREYSEDTASGQKGGDLGFFAYEDMVEPFSKAAFELKPNKISDIVQSDYGYHIIMVTDRAKAGLVSLKKTQNDIKEYLIMEKEIKLVENLITQLKNTAKIEYVKEEYKPQKIKEDVKEKAKQ